MNLFCLEEKCLWCQSFLKPGTKNCPICGLGQEIMIPASRTGPCQCAVSNGTKMLVVTITDINGNAVNYCINCVKPQAKKLLAEQLLNLAEQITNHVLREKLTAVVNNNHRRYNYSEIEKNDALADALGIIYMSKERVNIGHISE